MKESIFLLAIRHYKVVIVYDKVVLLHFVKKNVVFCPADSSPGSQADEK